MTDPRSQSTFQVRLDWGSAGLARLAESGIVIVVDAIDTADTGEDGAAARGPAYGLAAEAAALSQAPTVFLATLRNATATARAAFDEQLARGGRTSMNLVLVGNESGGFAVEDYLAAGAIADALTALGIDHSAPDVAVAAEGFRPLRRALKHLFSASGAGRTLAQAERRDEVQAAAALDADAAATRFAH